MSIIVSHIFNVEDVDVGEGTRKATKALKWLILSFIEVPQYIITNNITTNTSLIGQAILEMILHMLETKGKKML